MGAILNGNILFPFFTNTHTHVPPPPSDDLLLWHCAADALARPGLFPLDESCGGVTGVGEGRRRLRGKADTFLSQIMLLPPLEKKMAILTLFRIFRMDAFSFISYLRGKGVKGKKAFKCDKHMLF